MELSRAKPSELEVTVYSKVQTNHPFRFSWEMPPTSQMASLGVTALAVFSAWPLLGLMLAQAASIHPRLALQICCVVGDFFLIPEGYT